MMNIQDKPRFKAPVLQFLSNKATDLKTGNFIKKRLQHRCCTVNIAKFLRTAFFIEHLWWLLLTVFDEVTVQYWSSVSAKMGYRSGQSMFFTCH